MREIELTQGFVTLVDDTDHEWLSRWKWHVLRVPRRKTVYAMRTAIIDGRKTTVLMHREILGVGPGVHADHRDGNGLNNARSNLRQATHAENMRNRPVQRNNLSGIKGVSRSRTGNRWFASIKINGRKKHLGSFLTPEEAHLAYKKAAAEVHGEFAHNDNTTPAVKSR